MHWFAGVGFLFSVGFWFVSFVSVSALLMLILAFLFLLAWLVSELRLGGGLGLIVLQGVWDFTLLGLI